MSDLILTQEPMTMSIDEQLQPYLFEVEKRKAGYEITPMSLFPITNLVDTNKYQAIVRRDNDKLISIMPSTYKMVSKF